MVNQITQRCAIKHGLHPARHPVSAGDQHTDGGVERGAWIDGNAAAVRLQRASGVALEPAPACRSPMICKAVLDHVDHRRDRALLGGHPRRGGGASRTYTTAAMKLTACRCTSPQRTLERAAGRTPRCCRVTQGTPWPTRRGEGGEFQVTGSGDLTRPAAARPRGRAAPVDVPGRAGNGQAPVRRRHGAAHVPPRRVVDDIDGCDLRGSSARARRRTVPSGWTTEASAAIRGLRGRASRAAAAARPWARPGRRSASSPGPRRSPAAPACPPR